LNYEFLSADRKLRVHARWAILRQPLPSINLSDNLLIIIDNSTCHRVATLPQGQTTAQMAAYRLARRKPHSSAIAALRLLARGFRALPEAPAVGALMLLYDSESVNIRLKKYLMANFNAAKTRTISIHACS